MVIPDVLGTDQLRALVLDLLTKQGLDAEREQVFVMNFTELVTKHQDINILSQSDWKEDKMSHEHSFQPGDQEECFTSVQG